MPSTDVEYYPIVAQTRRTKVLKKKRVSKEAAKDYDTDIEYTESMNVKNRRRHKKVSKNAERMVDSLINEKKVIEEPRQEKKKEDLWTTDCGNNKNNTDETFALNLPTIPNSNLGMGDIWTTQPSSWHDTLSSYFPWSAMDMPLPPFAGFLGYLRSSPPQRCCNRINSNTVAEFYPDSPQPSIPVAPRVIRRTLRR